MTFELRLFDPIGASELRREQDDIRDKIVALMVRERDLESQLNRGVSHRKHKPPASKRLRKVVSR
jgi:hypothetical protein